MKSMKPSRKKQLEYLARRVVSDALLCRFIHYIRQNKIYADGTWTADIISFCAGSFWEVNSYWDGIANRQFTYFDTRKLSKRANRYCKIMGERANGQR